MKKILSWLIAGNIFLSALPVLASGDCEEMFFVAKTNYIEGTSGKIITNAEDTSLSSTDTSVLTVEEDGVFNAVGVGKAKIIAASGDVTEEFEITVHPSSTKKSRPAEDLKAGTLTTSNDLSAQRKGSTVFANTYQGTFYYKYSISGAGEYDGATLGGTASNNTNDTEVYYLAVWEIEEGLERFEFFSHSYNDARDDDNGGELANRYRVAFMETLDADTTAELREELITVENGANTFTGKCTEKEANVIQKNVWYDVSTKIDVFEYSDIPENAKYVAVLMNAGKLAYYRDEQLIEIPCLTNTAKIRFGGVKFSYSDSMVSGEITEDKKIALTYSGKDINPELLVKVNGKTADAEIEYDEDTYTQYIDTELNYYDEIEITSEFGEFNTTVGFDKTAEKLSGSMVDVVTDSERINITEKVNSFTAIVGDDVVGESEKIKIRIQSENLKVGKSYIINAMVKGEAVVSVNRCKAVKLTEKETSFEIGFVVPEGYKDGDLVEILIEFCDGNKMGAVAEFENLSEIEEELATNLIVASEGNKNELTMENKTIELEAMLVNQNNNPGGLEQKFEWKIFENDMKTEVDSKLIYSEPSEDGNSSKVSVGFGIYANPGEYYAVVKAENYKGFKKAFRFNVDKLSGDEYVISQLNSEEAESLKENLNEYLTLFDIDEDIKNNLNYKELAKLIAERRKNEKFTKENVDNAVLILAVISIYNINDNNITLSGEDGTFVFSDVLRFDSCDGEATLTDIYKTLMSPEGQAAVVEAVTGKGFLKEQDFYTALYEAIFLNSIKYPDVLGSDYIEKILTENNAKIAGINISKYLNLNDKSDANFEIARNLYTKETLEIAVENLKQKGNSGSGKPGSSSGGGSSGGGSYSVGTPQIVTVVSDEVPGKFTDVPESHWAYDEIYHLRKLGAVSGIDGEHFAPESKVTREQFLKMLIDSLEIEKDLGEIEFSDVQGDAWYREYIETAVNNGMVKGISESEFGVGRYITRQDLCVIVMRAMKGVSEEETFCDFADYDSVSDYAREAVGFLNGCGIVNGFSDGTFRPQENCTRAQAAKIICTLINLGGIS